MGSIWKLALARVYRANYATSHISYRIGMGMFALYQGIVRIIFDESGGATVGVIASHHYGMLQAVTAFLLLLTAYKYRATD